MLVGTAAKSAKVKTMIACLWLVCVRTSVTTKHWTNTVRSVSQISFSFVADLSLYEYLNFSKLSLRVIVKSRQSKNI